MKKSFLLLLLPLFASCEESEVKTDEAPIPRISIEGLPTATSDSITFTVTASDADECRYLCVEGDYKALQADEILSRGEPIAPGTPVEIPNLKPDVWYTLAVAARNENLVGTPDCVTVRTQERTPDKRLQGTWAEGSYLGDTEASGAGNYSVYLTDAPVGPGGFTGTGDVAVLTLYGELPANTARIALPSGTYAFSDGKGVAGTLSAESFLSTVDAAGQIASSGRKIVAGTIAVSQTGSKYTLSGTIEVETATDGTELIALAFEGALNFTDRAPRQITISTVYEATYFADSDGDGVANYYLAFGDATPGPGDSFANGHLVVLDLYGAAAGDESAARLPAGEYVVQIAGKGMNQIDMATSGLMQYDATGAMTFNGTFVTGTVRVSYHSDVCTIAGDCIAGKSGIAVGFGYEGDLVFEKPAGARIETNFTSVESAEYRGDVWDAGTGNYVLRLTDDGGLGLTIDLNDAIPQNDVLKITPGIYTPDVDETGEKGRFIAGGTDPLGEPFGTYATIDGGAYLFDGGSIAVAYDEASERYTIEAELTSNSGLTLAGTYAGPIEIVSRGVSTDKIDVTLTRTDESYNYLYYDGADEEGYSQFTLSLLSDESEAIYYGFTFDLYCLTTALDRANLTIPAGKYTFDAEDSYQYEMGSTYSWTQLEYSTQFDDGMFYFASGEIEVTHTAAGFKIEANLVEEENAIPVHLLYEGPLAWDSSDLPEAMPRKSPRSRSTRRGLHRATAPVRLSAAAKVATAASDAAPALPRVSIPAPESDRASRLATTVAPQDRHARTMKFAFAAPAAERVSNFR